MRKIIDVRFRPPIGTFLKMTMFKDKNRTSAMTRAMGMEMCPSVREDSMALLINEMDRIGNYRCCVSGSKRGIDPAWGWIENDEVFAMINQYPDRFIGVGAIDATVERSALEDVDRSIRHYGFKAIVIEPGTHKEPMYADDRRLYPIYAKCEELKVPVPDSGRRQRGTRYELFGSDPCGACGCGHAEAQAGRSARGLALGNTDPPYRLSQTEPLSVG